MHPGDAPSWCKARDETDDGHVISNSKRLRVDSDVFKKVNIDFDSIRPLPLSKCFTACPPSPRLFYGPAALLCGNGQMSTHYSKLSA